MLAHCVCTQVPCHICRGSVESLQLPPACASSLTTPRGRCQLYLSRFCVTGQCPQLPPSRRPRKHPRGQVVPYAAAPEAASRRYCEFGPGIWKLQGIQLHAAGLQGAHARCRSADVVCSTTCRSFWLCCCARLHERLCGTLCRMQCKVVCLEGGGLQVRWTLSQLVVAGSGMLSEIAQLGGECELQKDASLIIAALACLNAPQMMRQSSFLSAALQVRERNSWSLHVCAGRPMDHFDYSEDYSQCEVDRGGCAGTQLSREIKPLGHSSTRLIRVPFRKLLPSPALCAPPNSLPATTPPTVPKQRCNAGRGFPGMPCGGK